MREFKVDVAVIGGGPAGLAAALQAKREGAEKVLILERDQELGGILQQCIHDGFGLHRFGQRLSGTQYAQNFIDELPQTDIEVKLDTMVIELTADKTIYACNPQDGMMKTECLRCDPGHGAPGGGQPARCSSTGSRPAGVLTAGSVQRYINMEGYLPGKTAVNIWASGDIGHLHGAARLDPRGH